MTVKMFMFFWVVTLCGLVGRYKYFVETYNPKDGDIMFLQNAAIYLEVHIVSQTRAT
jgi:hypothetical protein